MTEIFVGQRVLVEIKCRLAGVFTDPTVLRCLVKDPDGSSTTLTYPAAELTRRDVGFFEANVTVNKAGIWHFRSEAAGVVDGVRETQVTVLPSAFA